MNNNASGGGGDPSRGDVGASGDLDAVVIRKDGTREDVKPSPIQQVAQWVSNLFKRGS